MRRAGRAEYGAADFAGFLVCDGFHREPLVTISRLYLATATSFSLHDSATSIPVLSDDAAARHVPVTKKPRRIAVQIALSKNSHKRNEPYPVIGYVVEKQ